MGLDDAEGNGVPSRVRQQRKKIRRRMLQLNAQGVRVERRDAHLCEVLRQSLVKTLCALQQVEQVGVARAKRWRENAAPGYDEVLGGDWAAVGPSRRGSKVKHVAEQVGR